MCDCERVDDDSEEGAVEEGAVGTFDDIDVEKKGGNTIMESGRSTVERKEKKRRLTKRA